MDARWLAEAGLAPNPPRFVGLARASEPDLLIVDRPLGDTDDIPDGFRLRRGRQPVEEQHAFRVAVLGDGAEGKKELLRPRPGLLGLALAVEQEPSLRPGFSSVSGTA
jgi:hypothetical protein